MTETLEHKTDLELPYWNAHTTWKRVKYTFGKSLPFLHCGNILDLGCSEGLTTEELQEHYPDSRVVGVDCCREEIKEARIKKRKGKFVYADGYKLRYPDETFDLVFCMNNIGFVLGDKTNETYRNVLSRISRLVKPNGSFLVSLGVNYIILKNNGKGFELEDSSITVVDASNPPDNSNSSLFRICEILTGRTPIFRYVPYVSYTLDNYDNDYTTRTLRYEIFPDKSPDKNFRIINRKKFPFNDFFNNLNRNFKPCETRLEFPRQKVEGR